MLTEYSVAGAQVACAWSPGNGTTYRMHIVRLPAGCGPILHAMEGTVMLSVLGAGGLTTVMLHPRARNITDTVQRSLSMNITDAREVSAAYNTVLERAPWLNGTASLC